jgi:hypothetical protein
MSTHSVLGVKMEDGSIMGCYVHYDGATMTERIVQYLGSQTTTDLTMLIAKAQLHGGMRSFHSTSIVSDDPNTSFLNDNQPYAIDEVNFYEDHMSTFAWYLVNYTDGTVAVKESC